MMKLFQIELLKFRYSRAFWGIFIIYALCIFYTELTALRVGADLMKRYYSFPAIWSTFGYIFKFFNIMLGFVIITNMTSEYRNRTMRQHIIDGLSREQFFGAKFLFIITISAVATILAFLSILLIGLGMSPSYDQMFTSALQFIAAFFVSTLGLLSIALLSALIFRNTGLAITIFLGYIVFELILWLSMLASSARDSHLADGYYADRYWPMGSFYMLFPNPWQDQLGSAMNTTLNSGSLFTAFLVAIAWLAVFSGLNYYLVKKKDLK